MVQFVSIRQQHKLAVLNVTTIVHIILNVMAFNMQHSRPLILILAQVLGRVGELKLFILKF